MKNHIPAAISLLLLVLPMASSAKAAVCFYSGTGDWSVTSNWGGAMPGSGDVGVVKSGSTTAFSTGDNYSIQGFALGTNTLDKPATLNISGGTLTAGTSYVGRSSNLSNAIFNLSGGSLLMNSGAILNVGNNTYSPDTFEGNIAKATFSGGTFQGGLAIGNSSTKNQTGLLVIQGAGTNMSASSGQTLAVNPTGTLKFILASSGVSSLDYSANASPGVIAFAPGATLAVDGTVFTAYTSVHSLPLIIYKDPGCVTGFTNLSLTVTGIQLGYRAAIVNNTDHHAIELVISPVPLKTFTVRDFGAVPNDGISDTAAIEAALQAAAACGETCKVVFEAGTYDLTKPATLDRRGRQVLILQNNSHSIVLEGNGACINVVDPSTAFLGIYNCRNIVMRNFFVDHSTPPFSGGVVQAVNSTAETIDIKVMAPNSSLSLPCFQTADQRWGYVLDPIVPGRLHLGDQNVYFTSSIQPLGGDLFRIGFSPGSPAGTDIKVGDRYVQLARFSGGCQIISGSCENLVYSGVTIYSSASGHFGGRLSDGVNLIDCHVAIKPGRWKSGDADGANFGNARVGPRFENCSFEGMSDDGLNIFMTPSYIIQVIGPRSLKLSDNVGSTSIFPSSYRMKTGDPLIFLDPLAGAVLARVTVVSYESGTGIVEVDKDLPTLNPGVSQRYTQVYNMALSNSGFIVRNNTYSNFRRYGNLIRGTNGVIEGNVYDSLSSSAIAIYDEPDRPEGLLCQNISISHNQIKGCGFDSGYLNSSFGAAITIFSSRNSKQFAPGTDFHEGINLIGNDIEDWRKCGIMARNINGGLIQENTIGTPLDLVGSDWLSRAIQTADTNDVQVIDNVKP